MKFIRDKKELVIFDRAYAKKLLDDNKIEEVKKYITYFFYSFQNKIFFFDGFEFILYNRDDALKLIPDDLKTSMLIANSNTKKFEKEDFSLKYYLKSTDFMNIEYKPTIDFTTNDLIIEKIKRIRTFDFKENLLNMAKTINNDVIKGDEFEITSNIKSNLSIIYNHIKNIICGGNDEVYNYVLNFVSATFRGRKLRKALYLQSKERTGKGIFINDILKKILGDRMCKTNSVESVLKYSKPFEGCCLINLDELPHSDNYKGVQDNLKSLITEPTFICRDMFTTGYEQKNTFNIIITTNNDAVSLTQNNQQRYVCLDISEEKIGDIDYFKKLSKAISSPNVLEAFYNEMNTRFKILDEWNEDDMPFTESRKTKIIEALPQFYKYIKEQYILTGTNINMRTDLFLLEYTMATKDKTSKQKLGKMISEIKIEMKKNSNNQGRNYVKSAKELYEIYKSKNWIDENVDIINIDFCEKNKDFDNIVLKNNDDNEIDELEKELENLLK